MDFALTEEQQLLQQAVREFIESQEDLSVPAVLGGLAELDLMGIFVPEEYAGAGCDFTSYTLAVEELAKVSGSVALGYAIHNAQAVNALLTFGSDAIKAKYLTELSKGEKIGAYAYEEAGVGDDLVLIDTAAEQQGNNYCLNGTKTFVLNGGVSDLYIVFAKTGETISAFVVEKDAQGVSFGEAYKKMGLDGLPAVTMTLENVVVPAENLVGQVGDGEAIAKTVRELFSISLAAMATGLSATGIAKCLAYGEQRVQFKQPIINFEAPREMLGQMIVNHDAARLLTYKAVILKDKNDDSYAETAAIARQFAVSTGEQNLHDTIQFHGGYGYIVDLGVEVLLRDVKGLAQIETLATPLVLEIANTARANAQ